MNTEEYLKQAELEDNLGRVRSLHRHLERELLLVLPSDKPVRLLDAGCGTGGLMVRLGDRHPAWDWTGLDASSVACAQARQRTGGDIREASVTALPFPAASFEAVVSADVLCQVEKPELAVAEFFRVLKPGGLLVLNLPAYPWLWSEHDEQMGHLRRFTQRGTAGLLVQAGFHGVQLTHWNALTLPLVWLKRKVFSSRRPSNEGRRYAWPVEYSWRALMAVEHAWLHTGGRWRWGVDLIAVGHKPLLEDNL